MSLLNENFGWDQVEYCFVAKGSTKISAVLLSDIL